MELLKFGWRHILVLITFILGTGLLLTGFIAGNDIFFDLGGIILIIPLYFFFHYLYTLISNQINYQNELREKLGSLEISLKKLEVTSQNNKEYFEKNLNIFLSIYTYLDDVNAPLPLMQGYTVDPEASLVLLSRITEMRPDNILDIGSGLSTLLAGYTVKKLNHGHVWSVEHHAEYYEKTAGMLKQHGLGEWVTLIHAPLKNYKLGGKEWLWYDLELIPANKAFDLVLVDGPPGTTQEMARYPALPLLKERISNQAVILLDDANRQDEKQIIDRWIQEFPGLKQDIISTKKGLAILTK